MKRRDGAMRALALLASDTRAQQRVADAGGVEMFVSQLRSSSQRRLQLAVDALSRLSEVEENQEKIMEAGGIELLVELAKSGERSVRGGAVGLLARLAESEACRGRIVDAGGVEVLVECANGSDSEEGDEEERRLVVVREREALPMVSSSIEGGGSDAGLLMGESVEVAAEDGGSSDQVAEGREEHAENTSPAGEAANVFAGDGHEGSRRQEVEVSELLGKILEGTVKSREQAAVHLVNLVVVATSSGDVRRIHALRLLANSRPCWKLVVAAGGVKSLVMALKRNETVFSGVLRL